MTNAGAVQTLFNSPSYNNIIHSEKNHIRNITLHHSSIKAKKCTVLDTSRTSRRHKNVLLTHASHQLLRQQVDQCCRDLHEVKIISTTRQSQGITNSGHLERIVLSCCCRLYIARYIWSTHTHKKKVFVLGTARTQE